MNRDVFTEYTRKIGRYLELAMMIWGIPHPFSIWIRLGGVAPGPQRAVGVRHAAATLRVSKMKCQVKTHRPAGLVTLVLGRKCWFCLTENPWCGCLSDEKSPVRRSESSCESDSRQSVCSLRYVAGPQRKKSGTSAAWR